MNLLTNYLLKTFSKQLNLCKFNKKLYFFAGLYKQNNYFKAINYKIYNNYQTISLQKQRVIPEHYKQIRKEFLDEVLNAVQKLETMDGFALDSFCNIFFQNFLPKDPHNRQVLMFITQQFEEILNQQKHKFSQTLTNKQEQESLSKKATEIFQSLKIILELLDKGHKGLLLGDMHPKMIFGCGKVLRKTLQIIQSDQQNILRQSQQMPQKSQQDIQQIMENSGINNQYEDIIADMYEDLCKYAFQGLFKLPVLGVKNPDQESKRNLYERQLILEEESNEIAIDKFLKVYNDLQNFEMSYNLHFAKKYIVEWFPNLCKAIKDEQQACVMGELRGERKYYADFISRLSSEKLAIISLTELMKQILRLTQKWKDDDELSNLNSCIISKALFDAIGQTINMQFIYEYEEKLLKEKEKTAVKNLTAKILEKKDNKLDEKTATLKAKTVMSQKSSANKQRLADNIFKRRIDSSAYVNIGIPKEIQIKIGSMLVYLMKETIKIKNDYNFWIPLIVPSYRKTKKKDGFVGILNINETFLIGLSQKAEKTDSFFLHLDRCLPMVYKPAPWYDYEIGGYYKRPTNLMRIHESKQQEKCLKYADLNQIFSILNLIGETPWRINKGVFNVMEAIWEEGGGMGEIPKRHYDYKDYVYQYQLNECKNRKDKIRLLQKIQQQRDMHSLRCDFSLKINVARAFKNISKIYFPHNIDFRGRLYPIPPHLNHMGADISRGLLEFAEGRPLGKKGLYWLKIHLANKMGKDKLSFKERLDYVESMMGVVEKCAQDPLKNREWLQFEDSWQTLAAMLELMTALKSKNPEEHISNLHVHMDGSCNGMQHYAALGRDIDGAKQVNLMNAEKPGDLYSHVAGMVEKKVLNDSQNPQSKFHKIAKKLAGNIKRKVVKQTVMTSVYGVTFIGARKQIFKQLKDKDFLDDKENEPYEASYYLALSTLDCIKDLFSGAHGIKKWLIACAGLIANTQNPVSWITPLGLPVVQPYRSKSQLDIISTVIQKVSITSEPDNMPINKSKQRSAFPPNFIHSLDSTHLMYTSIVCKQEGISFAAVHDSYWTHAGSIDRMNQILRDQFVKLHSQPLLEDLKSSFEKRFPNIEFPQIPLRGSLDLKEVKLSDYFFA